MQDGTLQMISETMNEIIFQYLLSAQSLGSVSMEGNSSLLSMTKILEFDPKKTTNDFTEALQEENEGTIQLTKQRLDESQTIQSIKSTIKNKVDSERITTQISTATDSLNKMMMNTVHSLQSSMGSEKRRIFEYHKIVCRGQVWSLSLRFDSNKSIDCIE